jgi:hypothetical protein
MNLSSATLCTQGQHPLVIPQTVPPIGRGRYLLFEKLHEEIRAVFLKSHGDPKVEEASLQAILDCVSHMKAVAPRPCSVDGIMDPDGPLNRRPGHGSSRREAASYEGAVSKVVFC